SGALKSWLRLQGGSSHLGGSGHQVGCKARRGRTFIAGDGVVNRSPDAPLLCRVLGSGSRNASPFGSRGSRDAAGVFWPLGRTPLFEPRYRGTSMCRCLASAAVSRLREL